MSAATRRRWWGAVWPVGVLLLVTGWLLYPVSLHPRTLLLGRPFDDVFESVWYLGWYADALFTRGVSPLFQPDIFYPDGWELGFAVMPPLFPALFAPVTAVFGPITTYNLLLIGSTLLAAYGVYRWHRAMGGSRWGGLFAGLLFAFYPNRQTYQHGFLNFLLGSMWLPWLLLALHQAVHVPRHRGRWLALAGLFFGLSIAGAWQFVYISSVAAGVYGGLLLLPAMWRERGAWLRPLVVGGLVLLVVAGPLLANGLLTRQRIGASADFPLHDLIGTSTSLERFLVPSAWNPLFWELARDTFPLHDGEDSIVAFGFSTLLLAAAGLAWRGAPGQAHRRVLLALAGASLLLMLGPFVKWQGQPVTLPLAGGVRVPLPALLIYDLAPPLRSFHHFGRLGMVAALGLGALAGLGLTMLLRRSRPRLRPFLVAAALLALLLELNTQPQPQVTAAAGMVRQVDAWLAAQPEPRVIVEMPLWHTAKAQSLYYSLAHGQRMVHGYSIIWPAHFLAARPALETWPAETAVAELAALGVDTVLVHVFEGQEADFVAQTLPVLEANPRLEVVGRFERAAPWEGGDTYLFGAITPQVDPVAVTYVLALR
ncbi:MAG: hypothetical protein KC425_08225 [Anaerolineales bacterium]|nr:hypothetical protein [Anaerolineales bacterium]